MKEPDAKDVLNELYDEASIDRILEINRARHKFIKDLLEAEPDTESSESKEEL